MVVMVVVEMVRVRRVVMLEVEMVAAWWVVWEVCEVAILVDLCTYHMQ